jgi:predicted NBD/HSP70 family sugar kinase
MESIHKVSGRLPLAERAAAQSALKGLRRHNSVRILSHLRRGDASNRAELARITRLDPKTVTNLTGRLLRERLIVADGLVASSGGRPAERLCLNPDGLYAVGVNLGATRLRTVVLDFVGAVRTSSDVALRNTDDARKILSQVEGEIGANLDRARLSSRQRVAGIGFCCPGFVDRAAGVALNSVHIPGWRDVRVAEALGRTFKLPVHLEESSRAKAFGELWFGVGQSMKDFVALDFGFGIGVGIVSNGRLHYGASESGGELGHTTVKPGGDPCRCGHRGCLETVASGEAIARRSGRPTAKAAAEAAQAGDRRCRQVITEAGQLLGVAVANLVNLLNPAAVILNGGLCGAGDLLLGPFHQALRDYTVPLSLAAASVTMSTVGNLAGAMGAAMVPLQAYFETQTTGV